jgi:putative glutamine amidotransferase
MLEAGSLAAEAAGEQRHRVLSHHHQAIDRLGDGLVVTGRSELDALPEAIEATDHDYLLGVQWHPEGDQSSAVIGALVQRAADFRAGRSATN